MTNKIEVKITKDSFLAYRGETRTGAAIAFVQKRKVGTFRETVLATTPACCYDFANALDEMADKIRQLKKESK